MKKKLTLFNIAIGLIILFIVTIIVLLLFVKPSSRHVSNTGMNTDTISSMAKPVFRKDGELTFMDARNEHAIVKIDVEVADQEAERVQGLMYRDSMPEFAGMLFLFTIEEPLAFWMKNTHIPLDIIYVGADRKVVSIARNTRPLSLAQIPSRFPAQYVVEVNAGFTLKHGIKEGDYIDF